MERARRFDRFVSWSPVLLLGGLAALTYWLDAQIQPAQPRIDGSKRHDVDIYVDNVRAVNFGANGKPLQLLSATRGEHFPDDESMVFSKPVLMVRDPKQPDFEVTANQAKVSGDRDDIWFEGAVHARREADSSDGHADASGPATLVTEYLHVRPREKRADTNKAVTIKDERGTINAIGMKLDADKGTVSFASALKGTIAPKAIAK